MATTDLSHSSAAMPLNGDAKTFLISNELTLPTALATNDLVNALKIPAGTMVLNAYTKISTAGVGTAVTLEVGNSGDTNGLIASVDGTAAAGTVVVGGGAYTAAFGTYYSTAGTIDIKASTITGMTTATKLIVAALCVIPFPVAGSFTSPVTYP